MSFFVLDFIFEKRFVCVLLPYTPKVKNSLTLRVHSAAKRNSRTASAFFRVVLNECIAVAHEISFFGKSVGIMKSRKRIS